MARKRKKRKAVGVGPFITALVLLIVVSIFSLVSIQAKTKTINETKNQLEVEKEKSEKLQADLENFKMKSKDMDKQIEDLKTELEELKISKAEKTEKKDMPQEKVAYLTFDDGPSDNTLAILDILKEHKVKGTFFVIGNPNRTDVYQRIVKEGHTIGNHTYSHDYDSIYRNTDAFFADVDKLNDLLEETTGVRSKILRFPGGSNNTVSRRSGGKGIMDLMTAEASRLGYKFHDWNVDSQDAAKSKQSKDVIVQSVVNGSRNQSAAMVLMHDAPAKTTTVQALPEIIRGLKNEGFKFKKIEEETKEVQF